VGVAVAEERSEAIFAANRALGTITLSAHHDGRATRRQHVHEQGSLRVRFPGQPAPELAAVIVNTAGGMAGGDRFAIDITAGPNAKVTLTTTAAEKVYRSLGPLTEVEVRLRAAAGASLAWLPQETILFDQARLRRRIDVELHAGARLLLAEAVVFGRTDMGESLNDGILHDRWRVRRDGRLIYAEAVRLDGPIADRLARPAVASGSKAFATILAIPGDEASVAKVRALEPKFRGEVGASAWNEIAAVRMVARDGAALRHDLLAVLGALHDAPLPRLWRH
jgi:urease accessory protein